MNNDQTRSSCIENKIYQEMRSIFNASPFFLSVLFTLMGFSSLVYGVAQKSSEAYFTAAGSMLAAAALFYTAYCFRANADDKSSQFYLDNIQRYFEEAILRLDPEDNNCIKWNNAIEHLKAAANMFEKLSGNQYREMYIIEHYRTAFCIAEKINPIQDYRFYLGMDEKMTNESKLSDQELYHKGMHENPSYHFNVKAINPSQLLYLASFVDIAHKINWIKYNKSRNSEAKLYSQVVTYLASANKNSHTPTWALLTIPFNVISKYINKHDTLKNTERQSYNSKQSASQQT